MGVAEKIKVADPASEDRIAASEDRIAAMEAQAERIEAKLAVIVDLMEKKAKKEAAR